MIANKHITKIVVVIMAAAVCLCLCAMVFADDLVTAAGGAGVAMEYESRLFDTSEVIRVNIMMDDADWEEMLQNATAETYYQCDVEINGKVFYRVGIRPKGNTSLSSIAMDPTTDRYSLKLEFDHYVDGQTCFGLDKLILNNNYADTTNMKEALVYDMYQYIGADASLYNYAEISVNDEYWGVYLALEAVEDSFLLRNYGTQDGKLYKPDSMDIGGVGGGMGGGDGIGGSTGGMNAAGKGGFSMGGGGANLNYTDDDLDSYSTIWECEVTNTSKSDHKAVVTALKNISQGTDLETYMDMDNLLKYMAVHVFAVNQDSLSGSMAHNYYLYEYDGKLNILPWDYNLSFGGMGMTGGSSSATSVVNDAVDTPFSGTHFFDTLLENEEYLQRYHYYLQQLTDKYIKDGGLDEFYERTRNQIDKLVETDPTSFYSYEEYLTAAETLYEIVQLRGESISGQLNGVIPSTDKGQKEDTSALIDASDIDINEMGTMNMGFGGGMPEGFEPSQFGGGDMPEGFDPSQFGGGDMPEGFDPSQNGGGGMPEGFDPSQIGGGDMPEGFDPSQLEGVGMPEGFEPSQFKSVGMSEGFDPSQFEGEPESESSSTEAAPGNMENGAKVPGRFSGGNVSNINSGNSSEMMKNLIIYAVCFIILIAALVFAGLFRRRTFKRR